MKFKLACADFTFPLLPHEKALDLIAALGLDGVDIGLFEGRAHLWPSREFRNIRKSAAALKKKVEERGLKIADIFLTPGNGFIDLAPNHIEAKSRKRARDIFARTLEYAILVGGRHISALPGVWFKEESKAASLQRAAEELAWRVEQAKQAGITFSVEAHLGSIVPTPREAERLVRMTPGLTLTLDYGHFVKAGIAQEQVEPLVQHASHFHVRGGRRGRLQTALKDNAIDFVRILKKMKETGYQGYLGIEYVWIDWEHCNEVDNLSETILFRDYLRQVKV